MIHCPFCNAKISAPKMVSWKTKVGYAECVGCNRRLLAYNGTVYIKIEGEEKKDANWTILPKKE